MKYITSIGGAKLYKKSVFIYAYTSLNLGDDLLISLLCSRYKDTKFYLVGEASSLKALRIIPNLKTFPSIPRLDGILRRLRINININNIYKKLISQFCDGIVNIGGSIFIENQEWEKKVSTYKIRILKNKPYFIIGSNFGPYKNKAFYDGFKVFFQSVRDVCFRELYSYKLFSDLPNVRYASDVVFSYPFCKVDSTKNQVAISVIDLESRKKLSIYSEEYHRIITEISRFFINEGFRVVLLGFCEKEGDKIAISKIMDIFNDEDKKYIDTYCYYGNIDETINIINESKYIIATRFHAMILGWVFNKPVYTIVYSDKTINVINEIDSKCKYIRIEDLNKFDIKQIHEYLTMNDTIDIKKQTLLAEKQFEELDKFLNN